MRKGRIRASARDTSAVLLILLVAISALTVRAAEPTPEGRLSPKVLGLIYQLDEDDAGRRYQAAAALIQLRPVPPEALERMFKFPLDPSVQKAFVDAGPSALPAIAGAIQGPENQMIQRTAVNILGAMARHSPSIWPVVIDTLRNKDPVIRGEAASQFGNLSEADQKLVIPLLRAALKDNDPKTRREALNAVFSLAPRGLSPPRPIWGEATPEVTALLKDSDPQIRSTAAVVLMRISPPAKSAVGSLLLTLKDPVREVRRNAAFALIEIDPHHRELVPILIEGLAPNADQYMREGTMYAFGKMGGDAVDAVPLMDHLLATDPDAEVRIAIAGVLAKVSGKKAAALPLAHALTNDKDVGVRLAAIKAIADLGDDGAAAIPALITSLGDQNDDVRRGSITDLEYFGKLGERPLLAELGNPNFRIREGAVQALSRQSLANDVVKALTALAFTDKSRSVRNAAGTVLRNANIAAGDKALAQLEKDFPAGPHNEKVFGKDRSYSKEEIVATIPADDDNQYPLRLVSMLPIAFGGDSLSDAEFVVTLHQGRERPDRLTIWRRVEVNRYRIEPVVPTDADDSESPKFHVPMLIKPRGAAPGEEVHFLYIVGDEWRNVSEMLFAIDSDAQELQPVTIESETGPGHQIKTAPKNEDSTFAEEGVVELDTGTYKIVQERRPTGHMDKPFVSIWTAVPVPTTKATQPR